MPFTTVLQLLTDVGLKKYAEAFDAHGWDYLPSLFDTNESAFSKLINDVGMIDKNGHVIPLACADETVPASGIVLGRGTCQAAA
jgi:hypothetical protein